MFICKIQLPSGVQDVMDMMNNMIGPIGMLLAECGAGVMFAISTVIFIAILAINVYYYDRKNAPDLC